MELEPTENGDARKEGSNFLVIHDAIDGPLGNLETVDMDNGDDRSRLSRVDVLVTVPGP